MTIDRGDLVCGDTTSKPSSFECTTGKPPVDWYRAVNRYHP